MGKQSITPIVKILSLKGYLSIQTSWSEKSFWSGHRDLTEAKDSGILGEVTPSASGTAPPPLLYSCPASDSSSLSFHRPSLCFSNTPCSCLCCLLVQRQPCLRDSSWAPPIWRNKVWSVPPHTPAVLRCEKPEARLGSPVFRTASYSNLLKLVVCNQKSPKLAVMDAK